MRDHEDSTANDTEDDKRPSRARYSGAGVRVHSLKCKMTEPDVSGGTPVVRSFAILDQREFSFVDLRKEDLLGGEVLYCTKELQRVQPGRKTVYQKKRLSREGFEGDEGNTILTGLGSRFELMPGQQNRFGY